MNTTTKLVGAPIAVDYLPPKGKTAIKRHPIQVTIDCGNYNDIIVMQDVFWYMVTNDMFFIKKLDEESRKDKEDQMVAFLESVNNLEQSEEGNVFEKMPKPIGMAYLWWDSMVKSILRQRPNLLDEIEKNGEIFGG